MAAGERLFIIATLQEWSPRMPGVLLLGLCTEAWFDRVSEALRRAGVDVLPRAEGGGSTPVLILFDAVPPALLHSLLRIVRGEVKRIVAVATDGVVLSPETAWQLRRAGASDVFAWERLADPAAHVAARLARWDTVEAKIRSPLIRDHLVGQSPGWIRFLQEVVEVALFTDLPVLILGESGTGKELVARLIHTLDPRAPKGELIILDCTTVVPELAGSEFFGHERGAYTGAAGARDGAFSLADGGTLFLDEVGELPPPLQAQILRVIQEQTFKRVGGNRWERTEFRLVCATNRDLAGQVQAGTFRHDLYHRLAGWVCRVPPLRDRREDVIPLIRHFLREMASGAQDIDLDDSVRELLVRRDYPGNVRDLRQLAARLSRRHAGTGPITAGDVPDDEVPPVERPPFWPDLEFERSIERALGLGCTLPEIRQAAADAAIRTALTKAGGSNRRAAGRLGVTPRALELRRRRKR